MSANIDTSNGRVNFAFAGDIRDIWHRTGNPMGPNESFATWLNRSGLTYEVVKRAAFCADEANRPGKPADNFWFHVRKDTGRILGHGSDIYQIVQPRETLEFVHRFVGVDDRFAFDTAGALDGGARVWAMARYNGDLNVAGDKHKARLLCTTSFDGSSATATKLMTTRVVCQNTLAAGLGERSPTVRIRHSTQFDQKDASEQLAKAVDGFKRFKAIGDAMATVNMSQREVSAFFKTLVGIPVDAEKDAITTRKLNQFADLQAAFGKSRHERNEASGSPIPVWTALQAVTRYVDHDRAVKASAADDGKEETARFMSANFGSGDTMKAAAWSLLLPRVRDLVPVAA